MREVRIFPVSELKENEVRQVELSDRPPIAVYNLGGELFATDDTCTHGNASLSEGEIEEGEIYCPFHDGAFDIRTGQATGAPCSVPVQTYQLRVDDNSVFLLLDE